MIAPGDRFGNMTALHVVPGGCDLFGPRWLIACDCGTQETRYARHLMTRPSVLRPRMCAHCRANRARAAIEWLEREERRHNADRWRMFAHAHGAEFVDD